MADSREVAERRLRAAVQRLETVRDTEVAMFDVVRRRIVEANDAGIIAADIAPIVGRSVQWVWDAMARYRQDKRLDSVTLGN